MREKLLKIGGFPRMSDKVEQQILRLRSGDMTTHEFVALIEKVRGLAEGLFNDSLPDSMDNDTYLVAKEYYDSASESLDCYLTGLDALISWADFGNEQLLAHARSNIARGDKLTEEVIILAFETQENFRETDEALMRSLGIDPEGIK